MQHFRNEVSAAILLNAPCDLPEATIEEIEESVLADAKALTARLNLQRLRDSRFMNIMFNDAISETKHRLRKAAARQALANEWEA